MSDTERAAAAQLIGTERDGLFIVSSQSEDDLKGTIVGKLPLLGTIPPIVLVPEGGAGVQE